MNGVAAEQAIWTSAGCVTMETLYYAYLNGTLGGYQIYYMDPYSWSTSTMGVDRVIVRGPQQRIKLITEDDDFIYMGVGGSVLEISDFAPVHFSASLASEAKQAVCAWDKRGCPGNKRFVRKIKRYEVDGTCTVMSLPVPNFITDKLITVVS